MANSVPARAGGGHKSQYDQLPVPCPRNPAHVRSFGARYKPGVGSGALLGNGKTAGAKGKLRFATRGHRLSGRITGSLYSLSLPGS